MKLIVAILFSFLTMDSTASFAPDSTLYQTLIEIEGVDSVNIIETKSHFESNYQIWFGQPVDHNNPESAKFPQQVRLGHVSASEPLIVEIEGYQLSRFTSGELAMLFQANELRIEHRFFTPSAPKEIPYEWLTTWQAATDQHVIIQRIAETVYPKSKVVTTGISKGGQCTLLHRSMYPDDADVSVPYVAPLNFKREDERIYSFLKSVGTEAQRNQIFKFQNLCFSRKDTLVEELKKLAAEKGWTWDMPTDKAFEYYVLEYSFAFWQWGSTSFDEIPTGTESSTEILQHVLDVSGVSFFEAKGVDHLRPFFWAALTEIGMYGYETEPFEQYLETSAPYLFDFTAPADTQPSYDNTAVLDVKAYLDASAEHIYCIYGGLDTWSATRVALISEAKKRDCYVHVFEEGHHGTRVLNFPEKQQKKIIKQLEKAIGKKAVLPKK